MKTAMYQNQEVTPAAHRRLAGGKWKELDQWPHCKICKTKVHPSFVHSLNHTERFDHVDGVANCPLSSKADPRYLALKPSEVDVKAARIIRGVFFHTPLINQSFEFCEYYVGRAAFNQLVFDQLLLETDRLQIWGYKNLALWTLPFIFFTLIDFTIPGRDGKPAFEVQFRFIKPSHGLIDDLWIKPESCQLEKVFRNTGKRTSIPRGNPYPLSEANFWITGNVDLAHVVDQFV